jgi:SUMO ligase MMS21 Smc5/6 complex component
LYSELGSFLIVKEKLVNDVAASATNGNATAADDDDDVIMTQEEVGVKCPYTQQVMKQPVRNVICGHNYESAAILEFIARKKGNAR